MTFYVVVTPEGFTFPYRRKVDADEWDVLNVGHSVYEIEARGPASARVAARRVDAVRRILEKTT